MKKYSFIFFPILLVLFCASCKGPKPPEFKRISNIIVTEASLVNIRIIAQAEYFNPNPFGVKVKKWDVNVRANGAAVGKIEQSGEIEIARKGDFTVPFIVNFPPSKILERESGLLGSILTSYLDRKIELEYLGTMTMSLMGVSFDIPIEYKETVDLK